MSAPNLTRVRKIAMANTLHPIRVPQDVLNIIGANTSIDPERSPLKRIVQHYYVRPEIQCSLSRCHRWHNEGYIVELEDGRSTNVGHVCGKQFGDKFAIEEQKYQEQILRPQLAQAISSSKKRLRELTQPIDELKQRAQLVSTRKSAFVSLFKSVIPELRRRAANRDSEVFESIIRNNQELEDLLAANPFQNRDALRIKNILRGHIYGLRLFSENVFETITGSLSSPLEELIGLADPQSLSIRKLVEWDSWLRTLNEKISDASALVEDGEQFFTSGNFKLISLLPSPPEVKDGLSKLNLTALDSVMPSQVKVGDLQNMRLGKKPNRKEKRRQQFGTPNKSWP